ncbi:MAG: universal stress protein [Nitrospirota bacterium]|nr:MAG: universal stress protein [Nitrospirota bacterium]
MKIVIAIDGSYQSSDLAQALKAFSPGNEIVLLHVIYVPQLAYPGTGMTIGHEFLKRAEEAMRAEGERIVEDFVSRVPEHIGKIKKRIETGPAAEMIVDVAGEENADLVMIGSRGLGMIREHALGSVSHRVTLHSPCSTLVVKPGFEKIKRLLLPIEHKEDADQAIEFLSQSPFPPDMHISLVHVIPFMQPVLPIGALIPEDFKDELYAGAKKFLADQAARVDSLGYAVSSEVITGAPSQSIHEHARAMNVDLLVMGVRRGRALNRFLLGSVSHSVVHHSSCSVLLLK